MYIAYSKMGNSIIEVIVYLIIKKVKLSLKSSKSSISINQYKRE
jgi:hypothetical protein